ncbi:MAG: ricin-type beta-trefoil lectin domain protein [Dongiaceae bacterium]
MLHPISLACRAWTFSTIVKPLQRRLPVWFATILLSSALAAAAPATAEPITSPGFPGKCVDAAHQGEPTARGAFLRLSDCNGSASQNFQFDQATSTLRMPQLPTVLCLDLAGPLRTGMGVQVVPCNGGPAQSWAFPFDSRLRPTGVDPNKCLTHATRPGKPPTGWLFEVVVVDPGCEFPEQGGGGFCLPSFAVFWEMMISPCDGRNDQKWQLQQAGMTFPPDGIVSSRVLVNVDNMHIDDCREAGACDWKVVCGLGGEATTELVGMVEMNTGGTINIGRQLTHEGALPATVTCQVREFDRGIFDPDVWEVVGTTTSTFGTAGPATMGMDNSEGKVTLNFTVTPVGVIQQPSTIEPPPIEAAKTDILIAMGLAGFDFSVPQADLRDWLNNPEFTPYPALAESLIRMLRGKHLRRSVFLDVVVFNYEHAPGVSSPRGVPDVDADLLARAVVEAHNTRYGESVADLQSLLE